LKQQERPQLAFAGREIVYELAFLPIGEALLHDNTAFTFRPHFHLGILPLTHNPPNVPAVNLLLPT
jgi:hypothetical protein